MKYDVEYTDTFGGEANYSWVRRATFEAPDTASQLMLVRRAKKALGLTNLNGVTRYHGDFIEFRPYKTCSVVFITWDM